MEDTQKTPRGVIALWIGVDGKVNNIASCFSRLDQERQVFIASNDLGCAILKSWIPEWLYGSVYEVTQGAELIHRLQQNGKGRMHFVYVGYDGDKGKQP